MFLKNILQEQIKLKKKIRNISHKHTIQIKSNRPMLICNSKNLSFIEILLLPLVEVIKLPDNFGNISRGIVRPFNIATQISDY